MVERANLVDTPQAFVRLASSGVVVALQNPLELSAHAVLNALGQLGLAFKDVAEFLLGISLSRMVAHGAPCAVLAVEQLVVTFQFLGVVLKLSAIRSAPVLHYVPVGSVAAVAGCHEAHGGAHRVHLLYYVHALFCKVSGQGALVLQSPQYNGRRVAAFLNPLHQVALETFAELGRVIPYMGRELGPPQYSFLVYQVFITQVVGLVGVTESVESGAFHFLYSGVNLRVGKGVALSELVLVLAHSVDEYWLSVQVEAVVTVFSVERPA